MIAEENIRAQFMALLELGSLPRSTCSGSFLKALRPLLDSAVVVEEKSGAGRRLAVRDTAAAQSFVAQRYPDAAAFEGASSRIVGVAQYRDTKSHAADEATLVSMRAWQPDVLFKDGRALNVVAATKEHGVFSLLLGDPTTYALCGACALVENPAVFNCVEKLNLPISLAIYGHGRVSNHLLNWLAAMTAPDFLLHHLPDYDPVGLSEFGRLRARLGQRVRLHVPAALPTRFARFSNRTLLDKPKNRALLAKLRHSSIPEIQRVVELMDRHNAGLEQEALLLGIETGTSGPA